MNATIIVMLMLVNGAPDNIPGFTSLESCQSAIIDVRAAYTGMTRLGPNDFQAECKEMKR